MTCASAIDYLEAWGRAECASSLQGARVSTSSAPSTSDSHVGAHSRRHSSQNFQRPRGALLRRRHQISRALRTPAACASVSRSMISNARLCIKIYCLFVAKTRGESRRGVFCPEDQQSASPVFDGAAGTVLRLSARPSAPRHQIIRATSGVSLRETQNQKSSDRSAAQRRRSYS